jgi:hypothetical protein
MTPNQAEDRGMLRRTLRIVAVLVLLVGLTVARLLPDAYYGPCSVTTEFHCGYHPRTAFSIFIAALSILIVVGVWVATSNTSDPN